jgi:nucleotide-binding universal stress UspA family protein
MSSFRTILITTDFSDTSALAFDPALSIAGRFGSRLIIVHVVEDQLPAYMDEFTAVPIDTILDTQTQRARESLAKFVESHVPAGTTAEQFVEHGVAHLEIVRVAEENDVDLVVMATHGRGFVAHAVFGSTTERVIRKAPCPVLTIREARPEERDDEDGTA